MIETAIKAAKEAEKIILGYYQVVLAEERKADRTLVTVADREAESKIREVILKEFPTHEILGEESGSIGEKGDYLWIVDPIDGTTNFHSHVPIFATAIALYEKGEPVLSVINLPMWKKLIATEKGKGAFIEEKKLSVSEREDLEFSTISLGYGSDLGRREEIATIFSKLITKTRTGRIYGSKVAQGALVALGEIEAFISDGGSAWDFASTALAIREAGGRVSDFTGEDWNLDSSYFLATNGKIHEKLLSVIKN
jgi:histidinol phosphatase-like enzyme (inositol monophosphatase family)